MEFVRSSFLKLFTTELDISSLLAPGYDLDNPHLSIKEAQLINLPVTDEEICHALWSLKAFKALGPVGLHAGFFQKFWQLMGSSISDKIKNIFTEKRVPTPLNQTYIALISKIKGPETIGNFKPISLCNTVYKIITKIIVARIRPYLDKLVSPFQTAFVPGRKGVDNAIIS